MIEYAVIKISGYGKWKVVKYNDYINNYSNGYSTTLHDCFNKLDIVNVMKNYFQANENAFIIVE